MRVVVCPYYKVQNSLFCAWCPEDPPCVKLGLDIECEECTLPDCPCMEEPTPEREKAFKAWQERRKKSTKKRKKSPRLRECANPNCHNLVTSSSKSGLCRSCSQMLRFNGKYK